MVQKEKSATTVTGGLARFSYVHVFTPTSMKEGDPKKYGANLLIPKSNVALVTQIKKAIKAAIEKDKSKWGNKMPAQVPGFKMPLRDGDLEKSDNPEYEGMWFINASSTTKPGVVDINRVHLTTDDEFYSGCWGRFSINFYGFNKNGGKGIAAGLNHLQKIKDDERLSGRPSVDEVFNDDYEGEMEDDDLL